MERAADPRPLQGFVDKWLQREPEIALLEVFFPPAERALLRAWGALGTELSEAVFEIGEPAVARTKLAWWSEDLGAGRAGRHPLSRALFEMAPTLPAESWRGLLLAAQRLLDSDHQPGDLVEALEELEPYATALAAIESRLSGAPADAAAVGLRLQWERSLRGLQGIAPDRARIPGQHPARITPAHCRGYALALQAALPSVRGGSALCSFRRLVDEYRLVHLADHGDPARITRVPPLRGLWLGWRAARLRGREQAPAASRQA